MKLTSKQRDFVKSLGVIRDGQLVIALVQLDGVTSDRQRSDYDDRFEKFSTLVSKFTPDENGEIVIPLKDLCMGESAPFTFSQANAPATWAGSAVGSRAAYELGGYKTTYDSNLDPDTGNQRTIVTLRQRTEQERAQIDKQIAEADQKEEARKVKAQEARKAAKAAAEREAQGQEAAAAPAAAPVEDAAGEQPAEA